MTDPECDCGIPLLEGAGQHSPGCAVFCRVVIPGVGKCELDADGHEVHRRGVVTWNGVSGITQYERPKP